MYVAHCAREQPLGRDSKINSKIFSLSFLFCEIVKGTKTNLSTECNPWPFERVSPHQF